MSGVNSSESGLSPSLASSAPQSPALSILGGDQPLLASSDVKQNEATGMSASAPHIHVNFAEGTVMRLSAVVSAVQ